MSTQDKLAQAHELGAKGAPATEEERLLFEAWMRGHCWALCATWDGKQYRSDAESGGCVDPRAMRTRQLFAAWRDRAALAAHEAEAQAVRGGAEGFDAFLCRAWGETDLPSAELVEGWEGVRRFMVREWLGADDATDYDGTVTLDRLKADFDEHEEDQRGGAYEIEFEIGGVSIERVVGFRPAATLAAAPQPEAQTVVSKLADFRGQQIRAGIPDEDLMPTDPAAAVDYLISNAKEWR